MNAATVSFALALLLALAPVRAHAADKPGAGYFPNVTLTNQNGEKVRFYDDLIKDKIVAINLIYTTCQYACPLETARLAQVQKALGARVGRDVFFYSITIDPDNDTPEVLKKYAEKFKAGPGWMFLTGKMEDIDLIAKKVGLYSKRAATTDGHTPYLLIGNESTGQWMRNSAVDNAQILAKRLGDWMDSWRSAPKVVKSYAEVPTMKMDRGQYTFSTHCAACHSIGSGDRIGPDLHGVTARRTRDWLTRFIVEPNKMMAEGDPVAVALKEKFKEVRMPNLDLAPEDARFLLDYIEAESRSPRGAGSHTEPVAPAAKGTVSKSLTAPYLQIQQALHADTIEGVGTAAAAIAAEAAKLGPNAAGIRAAAAKFSTVTGLKGGRAAMGALSEALLTYATASGLALGEGVEMAYCPMVQKYWIQRGAKVQNPYYGAAMSDCGRIAKEFKKAGA